MLRPAQSCWGSALEAVANVLVGYLVALAAQQLVFPLFGIHTTLAQDSAIAAVFTAVSLARSFLLRRLFERVGTGQRRCYGRATTAGLAGGS